MKLIHTVCVLNITKLVMKIHVYKIFSYKPNRLNALAKDAAYFLQINRVVFAIDELVKRKQIHILYIL